MIEAHVRAEIEALERTAELVLRVAGDTPVAQALRAHAGDLVRELGRVRTWAALADRRALCRKARAEALCYTQAVLLREHGLDGGAMAAAEGLVAHLCRTAGVPPNVVIGVSAGPESFTRAFDLVRLPPHPTVWHLPVLAHEVGHYVVRELRHVRERDERPLRELADRTGEEELVADCYAAYTIGPAYPLSCVWLRIDPERADVPGTTHPSWRRRVRTMVALLRSMTAKYGTGQYAAAAERMILPAWSRLTGSPLWPEGDAPPEEPGPARAILTQLDRHLGPARYDVGPHLASAAQALAGDGPPGPGVTAAHLLNAAWSARLRGDGGPDLDRRALALLAGGA
ncbi:hypothetical protein [Nonomuraea longicatena]|uniref:Uncharacterized protein n=1 Tax=Nonomuraea longicatena TaxID=83682 RepID=A0ABN1NNB8_9ACTN